MHSGASPLLAGQQVGEQHRKAAAWRFHDCRSMYFVPPLSPQAEEAKKAAEEAERKKKQEEMERMRREAAEVRTAVPAVPRGRPTRTQAHAPLCRTP